jgi:hypothetical protein
MNVVENVEIEIFPRIGNEEFYEDYLEYHFILPFPLLHSMVDISHIFLCVHPVFVYFFLIHVYNSRYF